MEHKPLRSSNLESTAYDPATRTMQVKFKSGNTYEASGVDPMHHPALMSAHSPGGYYRIMLKNQYKWRKL